eukprot:3874258-Amphidinium_carterae.1
MTESSTQALCERCEGKGVRSTSYPSFRDGIPELEAARCRSSDTASVHLTQMRSASFEREKPVQGGTQSTRFGTRSTLRSTLSPFSDIDSSLCDEGSLISSRRETTPPNGKNCAEILKNVYMFVKEADNDNSYRGVVVHIRWVTRPSLVNRQDGCHS